jgi:transcription elongation factor GreA
MLENTINNAVFIEERQLGRDKINIGSTVIIKDSAGQTHKYIIITTAEADPSQGKISNMSPIGKSSLDKRVGQTTEVSAPSDKTKLEILPIH